MTDDRPPGWFDLSGEMSEQDRARLAFLSELEARWTEAVLRAFAIPAHLLVPDRPLSSDDTVASE